MAMKVKKKVQKLIDPRVLDAYPDGALNDAFERAAARARLKHAETAVSLVL
jgi:hypothetical protein